MGKRGLQHKRSQAALDRRKKQKKDKLATEREAALNVIEGLDKDLTDSATLERPSAFVVVDLASACTTAAEATIKTELEVDRASAIKRGRTDLPFTAEQEASIGSDI